MTLTKEITIDDYLRSLARNVYSDKSKKVQNEIGIGRNTSHCRIIHRCGEGLPVNTSEFFHARAILVGYGIICVTQGTERGKNHKLANHYRLTEKGKEEHLKILAAVAPRVAAVNKLIREGQA